MTSACLAAPARTAWSAVARAVQKPAQPLLMSNVAATGMPILDGAAAVFRRLVWSRAEPEPPGLPRLRAACEAWIDYLEHERQIFPGGCLFTTAAIEFDARGGPVRDAVARLHRIWRRRLVAEVRTAVTAGELPRDTDPEQVAFELVGLFMALNQEIQLFADPQAATRTRNALNRLLAAG
jgi:hypothetical protein